MSTQTHPEQSFVPDLCHWQAVLRVLLISQMLAGILVLANPLDNYVLGERFVVVSLFVHWLSLCSCAFLCQMRRVLGRFRLGLSVALTLLGLQLITALVTEISWQAGAWLSWEGYDLPREHLLLHARHQIISLLIWIMLLRYFFLQHQRDQQVQSVAKAELMALQARIRPHFLFNSLNSLVALIPSQPQAAEALVENLAELFRAALDRQGDQHTLRDEVALTEAYLNIEQLRLGARLSVDWQLDATAMELAVPVLCLQPLVENAVSHGIEQRPEGGQIEIRIQATPQRVEIEIQNPLPKAAGEPGMQLAQANIQQRLGILYGARARFEICSNGEVYQVRMSLPR